jgi:hypothetical protein
LNNKGQFSIIAALLVAVVIIATVITTYAAIRYDAIPDQPQVLSAVDETNLALKQLLGFTVGYYGSILQVTGNTSYAQGLATNYLQSGLENIADIKPEWGLSFNVTYLTLHIDWFLPMSSSQGKFNITYSLAGLGFYNLTYVSQSDLDVQILKADLGNEARVSINKEDDEPLTALTRNNFKFYSYNGSEQTWELISPTAEPVVFANGTYSLNVPSGVDTGGFLVQVEDSRGIMTIASSFSSYASALSWSSIFPTVTDYVDQQSNQYDPTDRGSHSDFNSQKAADSQFDTLTEGNTGQAQTLTLRPENSGSTTQLSRYGDSIANWRCVDDIGSGDGSSTYVYDADQGDYDTDTYNTQNHGSATGIINNVTVYIRCIRSGSTACYGKAAIRVGSTNYYGTENTLSSSWTVYSATFNTNPAGGIWGTNWDAIDSLQCGVSLNSGDTYGGTTSYARCTQVWVEVNYTPINYELDLEEQFTNVDYSQANEQLCVYAGNLSSSESLRVDVRSGSNWEPLPLTLLNNTWNNVSVSSYLDSSTFTIRFKGTSESADSTLDTWQIDAVMLKLTSDEDVVHLLPDSTMVVEWLQNGTIRWLGENLQLATAAKPIPPIPVKAIHLNKTIDGVNHEVPFQVEDWASSYRVPLGLTSNATVFSNRQMIVFLLDTSVSEFTLWWDGSDTANQTSLAFTPNTCFTNDNPETGFLSNGVLNLNIEIVNIPADNANVFRVNSTTTSGLSKSTAKFMRINTENSTYGAGEAFVIHHGIVRDVVQQEAEWGGALGGGGAYNCSNLYANIVLTLPATASYYTYQLRLMFTDSPANPRTITDLCPIQLSSPTGSPQIMTENGTAGNTPIVVNGTGTFRNYGSQTAHHWSQFISGQNGAGIMFTGSANQQLYAFDSMAGGATGALNVNNASKTIELAPVTSLRQVSSFTTPMDITWHGAVATFDATTTPIYKLDAGKAIGLWILAEYQPQITVTAET